MFGSIGGAELLLVLVLALLLFGPRKLPQIGRKLGDALAQFRKATHDFKSTLENEVELEEVRRARSELTTAVEEVRRPGVARGSLDRTPAESGDAAARTAGSGPEPPGNAADEPDGEAPRPAPLPDAGERSQN